MAPFKDPEKRRAYNKAYSKKHYAADRQTHKDRVRDRKREIRRWFDAYKQSVSCVKCGLSGEACSWLIEFHHLESDQKKDLVGYMVANGYGKESIMREVGKCVPVCANCHRRIHYEENQSGGNPFGKGTGIGKNGPDQGASKRRERKNRRNHRRKMAKRRASDKGGDSGSDQ